MNERNASKIKGPRQMEEDGIIVDMDDIKLKNYNPISAY